MTERVNYPPNKSGEDKSNNGENDLDAERRRFTGYLRFADEREEIKAYRYILEMPGSFNVLRSPFPDDQNSIYQFSFRQFKMLEQALHKEDIKYEVVKWPKDVKKPFVWPPGLSGFPR